MSQKIIDNPVAPKYTWITKPEVEQFACIHIQDGEFEGIVYHYENLQVGESEEDGSAKLTFNYHLLESFLAEEMLTDDLKGRLEDTIACILQDILIQQVGTIGNEDRTDDPKKSDSQ